MAMTEIVSSSYLKLLQQLKSILIQGLRKAQVAVERQKVKTYWQTGKLISKHLLENKDRAVYGDRLFERLSQDLQIDRRTLERTVRFYHTFPITATWPQLEWSHCRLLITVRDKEKRIFYEKQAIKHNWSVEELGEAIRLYKLQLEDLTAKGLQAKPAPKLKVTRGKLYTYRLIKKDNINPVEGNLLVDCGFSFWRDVSLKGLVNPKEKDIVESIKAEQGYKLKASDAVRKQIYTYKALVEKITDADTIWAHIDLGFNSWSRQKIRFRGIDAPEVSTQKGQKAKEFVDAAISQAPFVVIKTHYPDKYGRYLSDVFYLQNESDPQKVLRQGTFLNQQLLDLGLAKISD